MQLKNLLLCFTLGLTCCNEPQGKTLNMFTDIKGYFIKEAFRLQKHNHSIKKRVIQNGITETKSMVIIKWMNELSPFIESDINKLSWEKSYHISKSEGLIEYTALDDNLKTQKIKITEYPNHSIKAIEIANRSKNILYNSEEILKYIPDSMYQITKNQHVLLLGDNNYKIEGDFNQ